MLTPQEAESHVFPKASFGGYNMLQVDAFLDSLIEDYRTLYQENASLKSKMKVLVEKVEEYRATEDAMRMTLHSAQKMADAMVKEGEAKKQAAIDQIAASVEEKSKAVRAEMAKEEQAVLAKLEQVKKDLANEQARLNAARASTTTYIGQLKDHLPVADAHAVPCAHILLRHRCRLRGLWRFVDDLAVQALPGYVVLQ